MDTVWLIVSGSMLIVIGSIFWILPSPADRRRMKLRQLAYQQGFQVRAMKPEVIAKKFLITQAATPLYYYFRPGKFPGFTQRFPHLRDLVAVPAEDNWHFYATDRPENVLTDIWPERLPKNLADSVSCLYFSDSEVGLLWNEKADFAETGRRLALLSAPFLAQ